SWGGFEKQYQVRLDPTKLIKHNLTFQQVVEALQANNQNAGGGDVRQNSQLLLIHGVGRVGTLEEIRQIPIDAKDGTPVRLGQVPDVEIGHEVRRGSATANGKGEVVLGLGFLLMGENSHDVTRDLRRRLDDVNRALPPDVEVVPLYDRAELVDHVIGTVRENL